MRVHVNGVAIFFDVIGAKYTIDGPRMREKPTLILLHGGPGVNDHSAYRPMFESLADVAQLVLIDHRGNGRSDYGSTEHWTLAQWGDDLHAFCEALDIRKPVVLGNSFGGMVAMSYATRHPEHPGKLVVSSTMARGSRYYFDASVAMFERLGGKEVGELARRFHTGTFTDELIDEWTKKAFPVYTQSPSQLTNADAQSRTVVSLDVARHFVTGEMRTFEHAERPREGAVSNAVDGGRARSDLPDRSGGRHRVGDPWAAADLSPLSEVRTRRLSRRTGSVRGAAALRHGVTPEPARAGSQCRTSPSRHAG